MTVTSPVPHSNSSMSPEASSEPTGADLIIRSARIVSEDGTVTEPVDIRIAGGRVADIGGVTAHGQSARELDAGGRWVIPGLWDHHVHVTQWARWGERLDVSGCTAPQAVIDRVHHHIEEVDSSSGQQDSRVILGVGHRPSQWSEPASVTALDAVSGRHPVILISGDAHSGWLNSRALQVCGLEHRTGLVDENEWFAVFARLDEIAPTQTPEFDQVQRAMTAALTRGIVGITDLEFAGAHRVWPERIAAGMIAPRIRAGFYPDALDEVLGSGLPGSGLRTGDPLAHNVLLGPLKMITDGSLGSLTAHCCDRYAPEPHPFGKQNFSGAQIRELLSRATAGGLDVAVHAIGDAAVTEALDAFGVTGAHGSIEHAQLMRRDDLVRMAGLGVVASVQPAHLLDDRAVTERVWADRADRCFLLQSMHRAGVALALGSDAPIAPLDPWLAIDAAVWRAEPGEPAWNAAERLTVGQALFSSTNGAPPLAVGSLGDVVLLDDDPFGVRPRDVRVAATVIGGDPVWSALG